MAEIFLNPNLPNYFVSKPEVTSVATARSLVGEYEAAKVITFPKLRVDIDHDFWAQLETDDHPTLKKFAPILNQGLGESEQHRLIAKGLVQRGIDKRLAHEMCDHFEAICRQLLPVYQALFADYEFDRRKVMWRLNTTRAENLHVDTYKHENELHFARMFVNLDTQPRIWQTSWTAQDMVDRAFGKIPPKQLEALSRGDVWARLNALYFGKNSRQWWDEQPRHIAFFAPGDVWVVDSRQVAHQIFYGRRALSIDFAVLREHMKDPERHYLAIAESFRVRNRMYYRSQTPSEDQQLA